MTAEKLKQKIEVYDRNIIKEEKRLLEKGSVLLHRLKSERANYVKQLKQLQKAEDDAC